METLSKRWYKKKRYIIPLALFGLFTIALANSNSAPQPAAISTFAAPLQPQVTTDTKPTVVAPKTAATQQVQLSNDNYYTNVSGNKVHSPAYAPAVPAGASARCGDGTYSFSQNHRGTCSHHGGVASWLD